MKNIHFIVIRFVLQCARSYWCLPSGESPLLPSRNVSLLHSTSDLVASTNLGHSLGEQNHRRVDHSGRSQVDGSLHLRCITGSCSYVNEYMGNSARLVYTPLTERCLMTCLAALSQSFGSMVFGPPGSGKTETVRELSRSCAMHCVIFNCSKDLGIFPLEKMMRGMASCGAWLCLDNLGRVQAEVVWVFIRKRSHCFF